MHCKGKKHIRRFLLLLVQSIFYISAFATNDPVVTKPLLGSKDSVKTNYESFVIDYGYFSNNPAIIQQTYVIKNLVSVGIEEGSSIYIQTDFTATVKLHISKYDQSQQLIEEFDKDFTIEYKKTEGEKYSALQYYAFENAYQVKVKIVSITPSVTSWDVSKVLRVDNTLQATRDYVFDCSKAITGLAVNIDNLKGELLASWGDPANGQTEYDLEWAWIDESAITDYQTTGQFDQDKLFTNNATRVSISSNSYSIPLLYDGEGRLFVRVRPAQLKYNGQRVEGTWTWLNGSSPVFYSYTGHENDLNWQASTNFAEDGKRKTVIQYFDGTLRNRQTVTKDNTTGTAVVAESFYDYQGRPVIQVLPAPTINTIIAYTKNFNKAVNYDGYPKWAYDELLPNASVCGNAAPRLDSATGTARYYSGNNDLLSTPATGYNPNKYIPNAEGYPFAETRFTPDGRVAAQGGVGINYQLGSNHETKYIYEVPAQEELDALFGTDAGIASHYSKNIVKDANGQYSVSYTDMHGRTIATALAGQSPDQLTPLSSLNTQTFTKQLIDNETNRVVGRSIVSSKPLVVMKDNLTYHFNYQLNPDQLQLLSCAGTPICYDCLYQLKFSIVSDCNSNGNNGVVYQDSSANFTLGQYINQCNQDGKVATGQRFSKIFDVTLSEGSYTVNKVLILSNDAQNTYRDSVFVKNDTCKKQIDFYNETYGVLVSESNCAITCSSCDAAIGHTLAGFRANFVQQTGMSEPLPDSVVAAVTTAYNNARANCDRICNGIDADGLEAIRDIRQMMLLDVTPPNGQYANPDNSTATYSIFNTSYTWTNVFNFPKPAYTNPVNYTWNAGAPPTINTYKNEFGQAVNPDYHGNPATPQAFSSQFQTTWAEQLLPNHPEYCKLKTIMEKLPATYKFEADINALDNWSGMVAATATPGQYVTNIVDKDPFFKITLGTAPGAAYYTAMLTRLAQYVHLLYGPTADCPATAVHDDGYATLWQLAQSSVFCRNSSTVGCENSPQSNCLRNTATTPAIYPSTGCADDWNLVWKNFRTMYLTERKKFIAQYLDAQCANVTNAALIQQGHTPRFVDYNNNNGIGSGIDAGDLNTFFSQLGSGNSSASVTGHALATAQYDSTCTGYAATWINQLSQCDILNSRWQDQITKTADSTWLVDRLKDICKNGSDEYHYLGSSSVNPTQPNTTQYGFNDFPSVIQTFFTNLGITPPITANCNSYLITVPKPYDKQPSLANTMVMTKPSDCECTQISNLFFEYTNAQYPGTFSNYLETKYQTFISQGALDTLRQLCNGTYTCVFLPTPISLPPLLQCHGTGGTTPANTCITCQQYQVIKDSFQLVYNHVAPIANPQTQAEVDWNKAFENYANYKTGFSKNWADYVNFGNACDSVNNISCDSLNAALQLFYQSLVYNQNPTGLACRQAFTDFFNNAFGTYYNYDQWMNIFQQSCGIQPSPCSFKLTCTLLKQYINEFYDTYGVQIYQNVNCSLIFTNFINTKLGTNFTYAQIESNYHYLCGVNCPLNVNVFPNCFLLNRALEKFTADNGGHPWTLPDCQDAFYKFFNTYFGLDPEWDNTQIEQAYINCTGVAGTDLGCTPDIRNLCTPVLSCSTFKYIVQLFNAQYYGVSLPNCSDTFALFFNQYMNTNYSYGHIEQLYLQYCGTSLNVCSTLSINCTDMLATVDSFLIQLAQYGSTFPCATINSMFADFFNAQYGTSYSYADISGLYGRNCSYNLNLCPGHGIISPSTMMDVLNDFISKYPDPSSQFARINVGANTCESIFAAYFNGQFGTNYSYAELQTYYLTQCQYVLQICDSRCSQYIDFVNDFNSRYSSLTIPLTVKRQLFAFEYHKHFVNEAVGAAPIDASQDYDFFAIMQGLMDCIDTSAIGGSASQSPYDPQVLLSMKQVYYLMHPSGLPEDCESDFTSWFNLAMSTAYTYSELAAQYNNICGNNAGYICPVADDGKTIVVDPPSPSLSQPPLLCGLNESVFHPISVNYNPCKDLDKIAFTAAEEKWQLYVDSIKNVFDTAYYNKCIKAKDIESFTVTYETSEYHYTLYYYDQAGNIVRTVPPAGVDDRHNDVTFLQNVMAKRLNVQNGQPESSNLLTPNHTLATEYRYNTLNQVVIQKTPDAGISKFWYDRLGRLAVSQNAKQRAGMGLKFYSYTKYDVLGRITEVGQKLQSTTMTQAISTNDASLIAWLNATPNTMPKTQITSTVYDDAYTPLQVSTAANGGFYQKNLRNRVSYTYIKNTDNTTDPYYVWNAATLYSYDIHGNVDTLLQDYGSSQSTLSVNVMNSAGGTASGNRWKRIVYNYDLISGKVNSVAYQPGQADAFYHRYSYDAENRVTDVETSRDKLVWEKDARYSYYKHGQMARTIIGQQQVQGIDYAYTLQGQLKGINSTSVGDGSFDMGQDGSAGGSNSNIARDAYGISLNYFTNDYKPVGNIASFADINVGNDLFNGNLKSMVVNIPKLGNPLTYGFKYDQLNRLLEMDAYNGLNNASNNFTAISIQDYKEQVTYDANGNIKTYLRNGTGATLNLNNYSYTYTAGTNRLSSITNSVNAQTKTYAYDQTGNTTADGMQGVQSSVWNLMGKLQSVTKTDGTQISYTYDAGGNRISKTVGSVQEWYVKDINGNTMATYKKDVTINSGHLTATEFNKYGNGLIGTSKKLIDVEVPVADNGTTTFVRGETEYYLYNHLGSVLVTISDKKLQNSSNSNTIDYFTAEVVTATYYSAYGAISNSFNGDKADLAHNGQKRSKEISPTAQTALFWEYNGDVGRRWNVDPVVKVWESSYLVFAGNPIMLSDYLGNDAKDNGRKKGKKAPDPKVITLQEVVIISPTKNYRHKISNYLAKYYEDVHNENLNTIVEDIARELADVALDKSGLKDLMPKSPKTPGEIIIDKIKKLGGKEMEKLSEIVETLAKNAGTGSYDDQLKALMEVGKDMLLKELGQAGLEKALEFFFQATEDYEQKEIDFPLNLVVVRGLEEQKTTLQFETFVKNNMYINGKKSEGEVNLIHSDDIYVMAITRQQLTEIMNTGYFIPPNNPGTKVWDFQNSGSNDFVNKNYFNGGAPAYYIYFNRAFKKGYLRKEEIGVFPILTQKPTY